MASLDLDFVVNSQLFFDKATYRINFRIDLDLAAFLENIICRFKGKLKSFSSQPNNNFYF